MTSLPNFWLVDGLRTITIALWGVLLAQGFWTLWYAVHLRRFYHQLRRRHVVFISVFWHMLTLVSSILILATEISWKIIFLGVGKASAGPWTYPNVGIYLLCNTALFLILRFERRRYVKTKIRVRILQIQESEDRLDRLSADDADLD